MNEEAVLAFCAEVMRAKGYDPIHDMDAGDIFVIQRKYWIDLFQKYRLEVSEDRRNDLLNGFAKRAFIGGAGKVFEAFAAYVVSRASQDQQGPDWTNTGNADCGYCENRGIVSNVPVMSETGRFDGVRLYSFACVCDRGRAFGGMPIASDWMLQFAARRSGQERERLRQWRRDNDCDEDTRTRFIAKYRIWLEKQGGTVSMFRNANAPVVEAKAVVVREPERKETNQWTQKDDEILAAW